MPRNWIEALQIMLGVPDPTGEADEAVPGAGPGDDPGERARGTGESGQSRISWVEQPARPPVRPAPRRTRRRPAAPPPPPPGPAPALQEPRVEWDGGSPAGLPDLARLIGVEDAFEHTPLEAGERVAYCQYDGVAYHYSTWEFLRKENAGRCCSCGRSGTLIVVTLPGRSGEPEGAPENARKEALPIPQYLPAWAFPGQEIVGLEEVEEYIGQAVVVEAQVAEVYQTKATGTYFVRFTERMPGDRPYDGFKLVIFPSYVAQWSKAGLSPCMYAGRRVRVRGLIQFHPTWGIEILVNSPRLIQVLDDLEG